MINLCRACPASALSGDADGGTPILFADPWHEETAEVMPTLDSKSDRNAFCCGNFSNCRGMGATSSTTRPIDNSRPMSHAMAAGRFAKGKDSLQGNPFILSSAIPDPSTLPPLTAQALNTVSKEPMANLAKASGTNRIRSAGDISFAKSVAGFDAEDRSNAGDAGVCSPQLHGRCGFVVRLREDTPAGPWMCHHFTLDGVHCARRGLGAEHANKCGGVLSTINDRVDNRDICMGLRKAAAGHGAPILARCGAIAPEPICRLDSCPFLSKDMTCPYALAAEGRLSSRTNGVDE